MLANRFFFWDWDSAATSTSAADVVVILDTRGYGSKGHDPYYPLPDDWWEDRAKTIKQDKPKSIARLDNGPRMPDAERDMRLASLTSQRKSLASTLMASPSLEHLKRGVAQISDLDAEINKLSPSLED